MGIDFLIKSDVENLFDSPMDYYLKYALREIDYKIIFDYIHLDLTRLYDHTITYWSKSQVKVMLKSLEHFQNHLQDYEIEDPYTPLIQNDLPILIAFFQKLVNAKATIHVF